jgi:exodeoxyribonuclease V alpha subunit
MSHGAGKGVRAPAGGAADAQSDVETLRGSIESVLYHSEESGYTVCRVIPEGRREAVNVVGSAAAVWPGEEVRATGRWVVHPQHGRQFRADEFLCVTPTSVEGLRRYLSSGLLRGIGEVTAKRIVERFGAQTLEIIEHHSQRLQEVEGVGRKRRQQIKQSWIEQKGIRDVMIFLQGHGIGTAQSARIFRQYGAQAVAVVKQNPYRLCDEIWGVGFKTADAVAGSLGTAPDAPQRLRAGLVYVLQAHSEEGHCYSPVAELLLSAQNLLGVAVEALAPALAEEVRSGRLVQEDDRVYPAALHRSECLIAQKIASLLRTAPGFRPIVVERALPWAEKRMRVQFAPGQAEALRMALSSKVSILTGGPGVGKTTIIRALTDVFGARELRVLLAAPTGRAAKRMEEATGHEAVTIHRLLKYQPRDGSFEHHAGNPLEADVVIVDEASMMDTWLTGHFISAVPDAACLVFVGDVDQLPSVGPGNVLRDLIHSQAVPCAKLDTIFRQQTGGRIVRNAHLINRGESFELPGEGEDSDFFFLNAEEPEAVIRRMVDLVAKRIPARFGFDPLNDIQVLTPMRRNQLGADNLNVVLQAALNPEGLAIERFGRTYREGDRVMQIRNNYDKNVFNGDIGRIRRVDAEQREIAVLFDGRPVRYDAAELDELVHAYACSVHKSQGSEYPAVVLLLATQHFKLLQRNLLYTAITRARKLVCVIGTPKAVHIAIRNNEIHQRRTGLRERIAAAAHPRNAVRAEARRDAEEPHP